MLAEAKTPAWINQLRSFDRDGSEGRELTCEPTHNTAAAMLRRGELRNEE